MLKYKGKLREIIKERDIKQSQLALDAGVPQPYISRFDKSEQHNINNLFAVARALGISVEELFTVEEMEDGSE
jgi:transcriptional regulator with XRE-family HTH domain